MEITNRQAYEAMQAAGLGSSYEIQAWLRKKEQANLRDQFAMAALTTSRFGVYADRAKVAYIMADAMLEARVK